MKKNFPMLTILIAAAVLSSACASGRATRRSASNPANGPAAAQPVQAARAVEAEPDVRDMSPREIPELKVVHFSYDSDRLDASARATLKANAEWLKAHDDVKVQVAGHCDQRGTVAYNLALGQRRAAAVRSYYKMLGVPGSRVATISYGKEQPVCEESGEACWSRNRRAATLEAVKVNVAGDPAIH
jgi:peptidoglycan-associated lipoprotein